MSAETLPSSGAKPLRISWTALRQWEECSEQGWLVRQGHRAPSADIRWFFPGTVVDRCMRSWLDAEEQVPGGMAASVDQIMDREEQTAKDTGDGVVRWKSKSDRDKVRADCTEAVTKLEPILMQLVVPHEFQPALRFEVPFSAPHPGGGQRQILLTGELDLLVRQGAQYDGPGMLVPGTGQLLIWDLKMTRDKDYWRKTFPQLVFYELAIFGKTGQWPVQSGLIQPLCEEPVLSFRFEAQHRQELLARVCKMAEDIWTGHHYPKASTVGCDRCFVKHACPRFKPAGNRMPVRVV